MITYAFPRATSKAWSSVGYRGQDLKGLVDVPEHGGHPETEPGSQLGVGLVLVQVRQDQQHLVSWAQATPGTAYRHLVGAQARSE
jgi:hypothetical protein